jgi:uncharacterized protein YodC (DUF2158 family)
MTIKFKVGDVVKVKSGKTYRIVSLLDDRYEDDYNAVQMRDGKQYGPHRHFKHTSFVGLPLYNTEDRKEVTTIEPIVTVIITYPNDPRPAKHCLSETKARALANAVRQDNSSVKVQMLYPGQEG